MGIVVSIVKQVALSMKIHLHEGEIFTRWFNVLYMQPLAVCRFLLVDGNILYDVRAQLSVSHLYKGFNLI